MSRSVPVRSIQRVLVISLLVLVTACTVSSPNYEASSGVNNDGGGSQGGGTKGAKKGSQTLPTSKDELPDKSVKLQPDVVIVRADNGRNVVGLGSDGASLLLKKDSSGLDKLKVGDVLLLTGVGAGRVTQIDQLAKGVAVSFTSASLTDVVKDASLSWGGRKIDYTTGQLLVFPDAAEVSGAPVEPAPASFAGASGPKIVPAGYRVAPGFMSPEVRRDNSSMTSKIEYSTKTLKIELEFDPQPSKDGSVDLELTLSPKTDLHGEIKAKVHINPSSSSGNAKVANGQTKSFKMALSSFSGKADITADLSALKQTANLATPTFLKLSAGIPIPFPIAGIPFTITVKATIELHISFSLPGNTLHAEAHVDFGGPAGFTVSGGKVGLTGSGSRHVTSDTLLKDLQGIAGGPLGIVYTTELPKLEFGFDILGAGAGVFVSNGIVTSSWLAGSASPIPCKQLQLASVVSGGVDAKFFGSEVEFARKAFFQKRWNLFSPKDKRCSGPMPGS